jgi:hypothetical protein
MAEPATHGRGMTTKRRMTMKTRTKAQVNPSRVMALILAALATASLAPLPGAAAGQDVEKTAETRAEKAVASDAPIKVKVRNNGWLDMRVYAVTRGNRWRLGTASTGQLMTVEIPRHLQADIVPLELVAYPIGGSGVATTEELLLSPGDQVDWVLENTLAFSSVSIS